MSATSRQEWLHPLGGNFETTEYIFTVRLSYAVQYAVDVILQILSWTARHCAQLTVWKRLFGSMADFVLIRTTHFSVHFGDLSAPFGIYRSEKCAFRQERTAGGWGPSEVSMRKFLTLRSLLCRQPSISLSNWARRRIKPFGNRKGMWHIMVCSAAERKGCLLG